MIEGTYSVDVAAPVERVWQEVVRTGVTCRPMFGTVLQGPLEAGGPLRYRSKDGRHTFVAGEVIEVTPPRRLVHTFVFPNLPDAPTHVVWELVPTAKGTRITVTHSRFEGETKTFKAVDKSWPKILGLFKTVVETGDVGRGVKLQHALMGALTFVLPKSLRTEEVERALAARPSRVP
jgi:uncharacterized protein YndB with AHSA1/START domain